jgi:type VI secretion system secreted protein Hcp
MSRFVFTAVAGLAMLALARPASAENIYCTIVAANQGTVQSDRGPAGNTKSIPVLAFMQEVTVPYDQTGSGLGAGKVTHSPVTIVKEIDGASPQLFAAAVTNEILRSVTCTFYRQTAQSANHAYFKITLTNAAIVDYKDAGNGATGTALGDDRETIKFTYQKIAIEDLDTNTSATDDWSVPG